MSFFSNLFNGRKKEMQQLAYQLNMDYYESDDQELVHGLTGFKLFQRGRSRRVTNLLSLIDKDQDNEICIFDYRFRTGGGKNSKVRRNTVFFVRASDLSLPLFLLKPKNFFHRIGEYIGWTKDIVFDSHPDFSSQYLLQGHNEIDIRHVFNSDMLHFFTAEKDWHVEGLNNQLIFYRDGRTSAKEVPGLYDTGNYVYRMLRGK